MSGTAGVRKAAPVKVDRCPPNGRGIYRDRAIDELKCEPETERRFRKAVIGRAPYLTGPVAPDNRRSAA